MPFDSHSTQTWTDLGGGWARNENGDTCRTVTEIEDVLAEHCTGRDGEGRQTTFTRLTKRTLWANGGAFIANLDGHLPGGHTVKLGGHSAAYRLRLAAQAKVA